MKLSLNILLSMVLMTGCHFGTNDYSPAPKPVNTNDFSPLPKRAVKVELPPEPPVIPMALMMMGRTSLTNRLVFGGMTIPVAWNQTAGAEGYELYYGPDKGIESASGYSNRVTLNLAAGTTQLSGVPARFYMRVTELKGGQESGLSNEAQWPPATNVTVTVFSTNSNTILPLVLTNPPAPLFFRLSLGATAAAWQLSGDGARWTNGPGFPTSAGLKWARVSIVKTNW